jgi:hypothetical protein
MALIHGRPEPKDWTKADATRVMTSARDRRLSEASGTYGGRSEEENLPSDVLRLVELGRLLESGDWKALRDWRLVQMAALGLRAEQ